MKSCGNCLHCDTNQVNNHMTLNNLGCKNKLSSYYNNIVDEDDSCNLFDF